MTTTPPKTNLKRFFTPSEVAQHCSEDDAWVSVLGRVLDLSELIKQYQGTLAVPIVRAAGTDISHWFDPSTGDVRRCVDPNTGLMTYYQPNGRFVHVPTLQPDTTIDHSYELPWWSDPKYVIGELTKHPRRVRIINTLNQHEVTLEVCMEETLIEIQERYKDYNAHAGSYTWKRHDTTTRELDMDKTLDENGIPDESDLFVELGLPNDYYIPAIHVYFNFDLTVG
eukprot:PhM_4_TR13097/c0_g1_i1/m.5694